VKTLWIAPLSSVPTGIAHKIMPYPKEAPSKEDTAIRESVSKNSPNVPP